LNSIQLACKIIANAAKGAGIYSMYGLAGGKDNPTGDVVKKLDVFSNDCMINALSYTGTVPIMASEELEEVVMVGGCHNPKYAVVFDPLDGSSNIDANVSVGTIFGVYRVKDKTKPCVEDVLQKGSEQVCAGYCMYGDATVLVLTFGDVVNGFTLDPALGEFVLTHKDIKIPEKGSIYSVNEGNTRDWDPVVREYVDSCKYPEVGSPKKARYIGSMVADVHRTLLYGGIFMYPATKKVKKGKLRLQYELNPMAMLVEAAGGMASTGTMRILDVEPESVHCKRPCFIGSKEDVLEVIGMYAAAGAKSEFDESSMSLSDMKMTEAEATSSAD
jgi:fructose-1,6-bisphosphatase I